MPAYFDQGFFVREPAWHKLGVVLDDYPGREEGMRLAGHDFDVEERKISIEKIIPASPIMGLPSTSSDVPLDGWKGLVNSKTGGVLNVVKSSYEIIQNSTGWDVVDLMVGEGAKYETGITLKDGAVCIVTFMLDEPVTIPGDDSVVLPYGVARWTHDGSGSLRVRSTSVRVVCSNTDDASAMQAKKLGTEFSFRHTKNVLTKIEDAKMAIQGIRDDFADFVRLSSELAEVRITPAQRELFVTSMLPVPPEAFTSERVMKNVESARAQVRGLFDGPTIPEAHKLTAYGLRLAGVEYLDHLRGYRNSDTYVGRQLLRSEPAKVKLTRLIREVVAA